MLRTYLNGYNKWLSIDATKARRLSHIASQLSRLADIQTSLKSAHSAHQKAQILQQDHKDLIPLLCLIYDPSKPFNITSSGIKAFMRRNTELVDGHIGFDDLGSLLTALHKREISGHSALRVVSGLILQLPQYEQLTLNVMDKNLYMRYSFTQLDRLREDSNSRSWSVALAKSLDSMPKSRFGSLFSGSQYYASRKLDGIRCLALVSKTGDRVDVEFRTRTNRRFETDLPHIESDLRTALSSINDNTAVVLDGELCVFKDNLALEEKFGNITSILFKRRTSDEARDDGELARVRYAIFDIIPKKIFDHGQGGLAFSKRFHALKNLFGASERDEQGLLRTQFQGVLIVDQKPIQTNDELHRSVGMSAQSQWEGLMLRRDREYIGKRTWDLIKVKQFKDAEYIVEDIEVGPMNSIMQEGSSQGDVMTSIIITHKGSRVNVGSGFTIEDRIRCAKDPDTIIGKQVTVQYFQESTDAKGNVSLRFPTVKCIYWGGKRSA